MYYNYIAIEGTLGAGKTTLASRIANDFNGKLVLEEFEGDKNPFLPKFYKEPDKYSFQVEMTFLALRYQQLKDKLGALDLFHDFIISDYYVAKSLIFSKNNLQDDEYQLFSRFFNIIFRTCQSLNCWYIFILTWSAFRLTFVSVDALMSRRLAIPIWIIFSKVISIFFVSSKEICASC